MLKRWIGVTLCTLLVSASCSRSRAIEELKPGLGDIMGRIQQHHAKLYFAGANGNWKLAEYELDEIREGLDDSARFHPRFKSVKTPIGELVQTVMIPPLNNMARVIVAKNRTEFEPSFAAINNGCNQCHQAADYAFIIVQSPAGPMFPNQRF